MTLDLEKMRRDLDKVLSEETEESLTTWLNNKRNKKMNKEIVDYENVKVGDIAYENPDAGGEWNNQIGVVKWKGTTEELMNSEYKELSLDWIENEINMDDFDLIIISDIQGPTLFNYNNDPCGCVVFKE
jgi:hypothetical protein